MGALQRKTAARLLDKQARRASAAASDPALASHMIERNIKRGVRPGALDPHHHRASTPNHHHHHPYDDDDHWLDQPASPISTVTKSLHWSIADMTIRQQQEHSYRGRSSSLPFLSLKDLPVLQQPPVLRVVLLGSPGVGKSALLQQFSSSFFTDVNDYESMLSGKTITQLFDNITHGFESNQSNMPVFFSHIARESTEYYTVLTHIILYKG